MSDNITNTDFTKTCFVAMGFGIKTDLATGRQLDLNKSYRILIKPVVESKGLVCIRADEIQHSGSIDFYMYEQLLNADIVITDLSTANVNAFYELGIRHALRPRTTIVISEDKLSYPFDLNHIKITCYAHLGAAIDYEEVQRFRKVLGDTIDAVLNNQGTDSPVYTFLHNLLPPLLQKNADQVSVQANIQLDKITTNEYDPNKNVNDTKNVTLAVLTEQGEMALGDRDYTSAKAFFTSAVSNKNINSNNSPTNPDSYLIQRLALATYKAQVPDKISALHQAIELLKPLHPDQTNDPETVILAGKIEKGLFYAGKGEQHLSNAILYYERGYCLLQNRCNAINYALLLNNRANSSIYPTTEDKLVDMVLANRIGRQVLTMCDKDWKAIGGKKDQASKEMIFREDKQLLTHLYDTENELKFEILTNKAEAHFGLGEIEEYEKAVAEAKKVEHPAWMMNEFEAQINELREITKKYGHLLNPPWSE